MSELTEDIGPSHHGFHPASLPDVWSQARRSMSHTQRSEEHIGSRYAAVQRNQRTRKNRRPRTGAGQMNKSELDHVWHSVTSVLENEFRTRGWLSPQAARIEALEAALREIALWDDNGDQICGDIARAALEPEQEK